MHFTNGHEIKFLPLLPHGCFRIVLSLVANSSVYLSIVIFFFCYPLPRTKRVYQVIFNYFLQFHLIWHINGTLDKLICKRSGFLLSAERSMFIKGTRSVPTLVSHALGFIMC